MGFIGKVVLGFFWMLVAVAIAQSTGMSNQSGFILIGGGIVIIIFWGAIKKVISDWYEDNRHHRNRRKQIEIELKAMERRIQAAIVEQRAGHDRTMELLQFRERLLQMEAQENDAMVRAMVSTIDSIK